MDNKEIIERWMDYVSAKWLNLLKAALLRPSTENMIRKMELMSNDHLRYGEAWEFIEKLQQLHDPFHDENNLYSKEPAQARVKCAIAAYRMGDINVSTRFFGAAISNCNDKHDKAVIHWLRGCVYWYKGNSSDAITDWEDSLNEFEAQATHTQQNSKWIKWYLETVKEMRSAIEYAIDHGFPPPPPPSGSPGGLGGKPANPHQADTLRAFSISEEIPAGGFGPAGVDPTSIGYVDINQVLIDNKIYRIVNLRGGSQINFPSADNHLVLKVKGDSMDKARPVGIENGDFVIMKWQEAASDGDIVAAEIDDEDTCATLKYYAERNKLYILRPASSNPNHKEREFTKFNKGFHIRGIVIAIFKPI